MGTIKDFIINDGVYKKYFYMSFYDNTHNDDFMDTCHRVVSEITNDDFYCNLSEAFPSYSTCIVESKGDKLVIRFENNRGDVNLLLMSDEFKVICQYYNYRIDLIDKTSDEYYIVVLYKMICRLYDGYIYIPIFDNRKFKNRDYEKHVKRVGYDWYCPVYVNQIDDVAEHGIDTTQEYRNELWGRYRKYPRRIEGIGHGMIYTDLWYNDSLKKAISYFSNNIKVNTDEVCIFRYKGCCFIYKDSYLSEKSGFDFVYLYDDIHESELEIVYKGPKKWILNN